MDKLDQLLGSKSQVYQDEAHSQNVALFARAIGEPQGDKLAELPPTYLTRCRRGEFELFSSLGIPLSSVLHADQEYEFYQPLKVGSTLEYETEFTKASHKSGSTGSLHFLTFETRISLKGQENASALARTVIVVREPKS